LLHPIINTKPGTIDTPSAKSRSGVSPKVISISAIGISVYLIIKKR